MPGRLDALRGKLSQQKLDAFVVASRPNQYYLSGFSSHEDLDALLIVGKNDARIATSSIYWEAAERTTHGFSLVKLERGKFEYGDALRDFAKEHGARTIGFEANNVPYARFREWQKAARKVGAKLKACEDLVLKLRAVKDQEELDNIKRAVGLTDRALHYFVSVARPGMTEKRGAWLIEQFMRENGGDALAFSSIVASGPNSALPHAEPTDRAFETGEPITIDIGARIGHYNADLTRTVCLGQPSDKFNEIYNTVLKAMQAVEKKARAGLRGKQVDALARRVIEKAGYGENFGHGTGHGVGLAVHEAPFAGRISKDVLEPNMTLTVEPGIYLPGWGGVRIEDLVLIQEHGVQVLSEATKEPVVIFDGRAG